MADIKLVINITKHEWEYLNKLVKNEDQLGHYERLLVNGIPLDDIDSDETRAYFDGEAYGWEKGRKALIEDVKAEIEQFREDLAEKAPSLQDLIHAQQTVDICLGIIDNIGKGE